MEKPTTQAPAPQASAAPQHVVSKLTPLYNRTEDRLRVAIETKAGDVLAMWLTLRVANQLVMALARWLEGDVKQMAQGRNAAPLHSFEQSAAVAQHSAQTAVPQQKARDCGVVTQIELQRNAERYTVQLITGKGDVAVLRTGATEVRQLVDIFRRMFATAEWSTAAWPSWAAQAPDTAADAAAKTPEAKRALH
jgi:hypothetical protein